MAAPPVHSLISTHIFLLWPFKESNSKNVLRSVYGGVLSCRIIGGSLGAFPINTGESSVIVTVRTMHRPCFCGASFRCGTPDGGFQGNSKINLRFLQIIYSGVFPCV